MSDAQVQAIVDRQSLKPVGVHCRSTKEIRLMCRKTASGGWNLPDWAGTKQDPQKLTAIVSEMCQLLLEKRERLDAVLFPKVS